MPTIHFTVLGLPQPAGSKRAFTPRNKATGQPYYREDGSIITNTVDANPRSQVWKNQVTDAARKAYDGPLIDGPLEVFLTFTVPRPKGHFGKNGLKPSAPPYPVIRPDVLKLARGVEDSLKAVIYRDDSQIVSEHLLKRYGEPASVEVRIEQLVEALEEVEDQKNLWDFEMQP
jgi:Holliday junction resolvase RusA-like endonuclease